MRGTIGGGGGEDCEKNENMNNYNEDLWCGIREGHK